MTPARRATLALATLLLMSCQAEQLTDTIIKDPPPEPSALLLRLAVDVAAGTVTVLPPPGTPAPAPGIAYSVLGSAEVGAATSNLTRTPVGTSQVRVTFDVTLTNKLTAETLVPVTSFPAGAAGATGLLLFPYRITQAVGGAATAVTASGEWNGDGSAGSGAPRNFFNDFGCPNSGTSSDCLRWEQYPAPLGPGESTAPQRVGFTLPRAITRFTVVLGLAADLRSDLPAVQRLVVTPSPYTMADGRSASFTAVAYDVQGQPLSWPTIRWTTSDPTALQFRVGSALYNTMTGPTVLVDGRKHGPASLTARSGGVSVTVPVDVQVNTIVLLQAATPDSDLVAGQQVQAVVSVKDNNGSIEPGVAPVWSSSDPTVAYVDPVTGLVTAIGGGACLITVSAAGVSTAIPITVAPAQEGVLNVNYVATAVGGTPAGGPIYLSVPGDLMVTSPGRPTQVISGPLATAMAPGPVTLTPLNLPPGCSGPTQAGVVAPGAWLTVVIDLTCQGGLDLTVRDHTGKPLDGLGVDLRQTYQVINNQYLTDGQGRISFTGVPQLDLYLYTDKTLPLDCYPQNLTLSLPAIGSLASDIAIDCRGYGSVGGQMVADGLTQASGAPVPVPGMQITAARASLDFYLPLLDYDLGQATVTGADGRFLLDQAPVGTVSLLAATGICRNWHYDHQLDLHYGTPATLTLTGYRCATHTVQVRVDDQSAAPQPRAVALAITSSLTGSVFGGAIASSGQASSHIILADGAAFDATLANLPSTCTASTESGSATAGDTTNLIIVLNCQ